MVESIMYFGIGFLLAALSVLVVVPLVHNRAVRLTVRRLETATLSMAEVHADKDLLRAEFAMSTRRLEMRVEQLKSKAASQLVELGRKGGAINRLKKELGALRDQLRTTEGELAVKASAVREAERALSDKESELAKLTSALNERSVLADAQKVEIVALRMQIQTLEQRLIRAAEEFRAAEDRREAERTDKEAELAKLTSVLDERSAVVDSQKAEIATLKMQVQTLEQQLIQAGDEFRAVEVRREAERAQKESELAKLTSVLDERAAVVDSRKAEIVALRMQVQTLEERLIHAGDEFQAVEVLREAEGAELKAIIQQLVEKRGKFENFHRRVAELVQQLVSQSTQAKSQAIQDLENRLVEQSQLVNQRELELKHLRGELGIARKAEADLRIAIIEIDGRANATTQELEGEKAKLQAELDRANGERTRLTYELGNMKRLADSKPERVSTPRVGRSTAYVRERISR